MLPIRPEIYSNGLLQQPANLFQTGNDEITRRASTLESKPICVTLYLSDHMEDTTFLSSLAFSYANLRKRIINSTSLKSDDE